MNQITLEKIVTGNPFHDYPQLKSIWPEPYLSIATEAVLDDIKIQNQVDIGEIFLIKKNDSVIGITGYFHWDTETSKDNSGFSNAVGLRWHGIVDEYRGERISKEAISLVLHSVISKYPSIETLIELVPVNPYGNKLRPHFEHLGFVPIGNPEEYDWAEDLWQQYHLPIENFIKHISSPLTTEIKRSVIPNKISP